MSQFVLEAYWWAIPCSLLVAFFKSSTFKGWMGEFFVSKRISGLDPEIYKKSHDVTLPMADGTTQIDHVIFSKHGIFVIETKNYKGWIFGGEHQAAWTQSIYKKKYKFQNPLRQNYKHIKALEEITGAPSHVFHSVVVFVGDSVFKTEMPGNVLRARNLSHYILAKKDVLTSDSELSAFIERMNGAKLKKGLSTNLQHVAGLQERHKNKKL